MNKLKTKWQRLKYWQKGGTVFLILVISSLFLWGVIDVINHSDEIYLDGEFFCPDYKSLNWYECDFSNAVLGRIVLPLVLLLGFPMIIFSSFATYFELNIVFYILLFISIIIGGAIYYGIGSIIGLIIGKVKGNE